MEAKPPKTVNFINLGKWILCCMRRPCPLAAPSVTPVAQAHPRWAAVAPGAGSPGPGLGPGGRRRCPPHSGPQHGSPAPEPGPAPHSVVGLWRWAPSPGPPPGIEAASESLLPGWSRGGESSWDMGAQRRHWLGVSQDLSKDEIGLGWWGRAQNIGQKRKVGNYAG